MTERHIALSHYERPTSFLLTAFLLGLTFQPASAFESQATNVVAAGHVSAELLNMLFTHPIDEDIDVRHRIGRGLTVGKAHADGQVTVELEPNDEKAEMVFRLKSKMNTSNAVSYQGPVRVRGSVASNVNAVKSVFMDRQGMKTIQAKVAGKTSMRINDVLADRAVIERIAWRRVRRKHDEMEREVNQKTIQQFAERLNSRIQDAMEGMQARLKQLMNFQDEIQFPENYEFRSTESHAQLWILSGPQSPVDEPQAPIKLRQDYDLHSRTHQHVFESLLEDQAAGERLDDERVLGFIRRMRGSAPPALWVHDRRPRWAVTLREFRPIELRFEADLVETTLHFSNVEYDGKDYAGPFSATVAVRPELTPEDGPRLVRVSDPAVDCSSAAQLNQKDRQLIIRLLTVKLGGIMPKVAYFDAMKPPEGGSWDRVRQLKVVQLDVQPGWLELGVKFQEKQPAEVAALH